MTTNVLKENGGIPAGALITLALMAGISVANIYYCQPLLNLIRDDLSLSEFQVNLIPTVTQVGYACGLLFIIPMGDLYRRKSIVLVNFLLLTLSLLAIALSHSVYITLIASAVTGVCSVTPQIFIPIASQFSRPADKERNVGIVLSGLLTGILASRVISGFAGEYIGWREMYLFASFLMFSSAIIIARIFPDVAPNYKGSFLSLMGSIKDIIKAHPQSLMLSIRSAFAFGSFLAMWACLAFKLKQAPFFAGSDMVGVLGLCGIMGALTASGAGRFVARYGVNRVNAVGVILMYFAWCILWLFGNSYAGLVTGIIIIDIGIQCIQLSNQSSVLRLYPSASSRMNTIFMTTYFVGGATGTFLAGTFWQTAGWNGVVGVGIGMVTISGITALAGALNRIAKRVNKKA